MRKRRVPSADLGPDHFDGSNRLRTANRLVRKPSELGFEVASKNAA